MDWVWGRKSKAIISGMTREKSIEQPTRTFQEGNFMGDGLIGFQKGPESYNYAWGMDGWECQSELTRNAG